MKKFISVILAILMVLCQMLPVLGAESDSSGADLEVRTEEKVYAKATLAHDFAADGVFVVLSNKASLEFKYFRAEDFQEIGCTAVTDYSGASGEKIEKQVEILSKKSATTREVQSVDKEKILTYNQVLYLTIPNSGKQDVLDAIDKLMQREDVIYAGPNYYYSVKTEESSTRNIENAPIYFKLQLPEAWTITTGSSDLLVGVLDDGIDGTHPDLASRINLSLSARFTDTTTVTNVSTDPSGHGTQVAGIIAAQGNNTNGVKGVAPDVTLVSLDVVPSVGPTTSAMLNRAINYAESNDICLLNCSLGWQVTSGWNDLAIQSALENYTGLIVCAAGNQNADNDEILNYPSCLDINNLISVGASTVNDIRWGDSNYGDTTVDIFAPGEGILTTDSRQTPTSTQDYDTVSGTSFAAPFVTGTAALIWSLCPYMTPLQVKQTIMNSVDTASGLQGYCVTGGRLNVYQALLNMQHPWVYTAQGLTSHLRSCSCGVQETQSHSWVEVGTKYRCGMCGYITDAIPGIIRKLDDEKLGCQECTHP